MVGVTDPQLKANKEEGKSEMIGGKCNWAHENTIRSRPHYFRRCKKQNRLLTNIESLPDDLVFEILVTLPAQDIYNAAMLVCRNWYRMVHSRAFVVGSLTMFVHKKSTHSSWIIQVELIVRTSIQTV